MAIESLDNAAQQSRIKLPAINWRSRSYLIGAGGGLLFGLLSAYLYARAVEENPPQTVAPSNNPPSPSTLELIGLALAGIALMRQITELGRPNKKKK